MLIVVRIICALAAGLMLFRFAAPGIYKGAAAAVDPAAVTPYLDSEYRFLSALALGLGLVFIYLVVKIKDHPLVLVLVACGVAAGGLARILSMSVYGAPTTAELIPTIVELVLPTTAATLTLLHMRAQRRGSQRPA